MKRRWLHSGRAKESSDSGTREERATLSLWADNELDTHHTDDIKVAAVATTALVKI